MEIAMAVEEEEAEATMARVMAMEMEMAMARMSKMVDEAILTAAEAEEVEKQRKLKRW